MDLFVALMQSSCSLVFCLQSRVLFRFVASSVAHAHATSAGYQRVAAALAHHGIQLCMGWLWWPHDGCSIHICTPGGAPQGRWNVQVGSNLGGKTASLSMSSRPFGAQRCGDVLTASSM